MSRFTVSPEKVAGTRQLNYAVTDSNTHQVIVRFANKKEAEDLAAKLNERKMDSEGD